VTRHLFACPCCGAVGATSADIEWFIDEPDYGEVETEYFDEDTYTEAPEANPRQEQAYQRVGEYKERIDDRSVREVHVAGQRTGGSLVVETVRNEPIPQPKKQTRIAQTQALPTFPVTRPPKKQRLTEADAARAGFEAISADDPSGDCYAGLSGKELHQEQLLQAAYEADIRNHGFTPESNFI
jgi:hypothetical protein